MASTKVEKAKHTCEACGCQYEPIRTSQRFCSRPCMWSKNGGHNRKPESWWKNPRGYIEGRVSINGKQEYRKQHRWFVELSIGRPLLPSEDVHHKNGIKTDNRPENLELIDHGKHTVITNRGRLYRRGYKLSLSPRERQSRADRMRSFRRAAILKAEGTP